MISGRKGRRVQLKANPRTIQTRLRLPGDRHVCAVCGRELYRTDSVIRGLGRGCAGKMRVTRVIRDYVERERKQ
jgi:hypothetical protein